MTLVALSIASLKEEEEEEVVTKTTLVEGEGTKLLLGRKGVGRREGGRGRKGEEGGRDGGRGRKGEEGGRDGGRGRKGGEGGREGGRDHSMVQI